MYLIAGLMCTAKVEAMRTHSAGNCTACDRMLDAIPTADSNGANALLTAYGWLVRKPF